MGWDLPILRFCDTRIDEVNRINLAVHLPREIFGYRYLFGHGKVRYVEAC
jgi:hypothetical protein